MSSLHPDGVLAREFSVGALVRIAEPVLAHLAAGTLRAQMPVEALKESVDRAKFTHLEAVGRLLAGIAPWLELGPDDSAEGHVRARLANLAVKGIANAVNPKSPDYLNFTNGGQTLVDTAFLVHGLLRAPTQLWAKLDAATQANVIAAVKGPRVVKAPECNWLLFRAMVEAFLWKVTGECELPPLEYAVTKHLDWYLGDGTYGDGEPLHWDYYNSFVIQPMLLDVLRVCAEKGHALGAHYPLTLERAQRYAVVQERMISPEGTFPIVGRSSTYRFGAFQMLSQLALEKKLEAIAPAAVRAGLTAVIRRMVEAPGTFDANGWLTLGVVGHQPLQSETYISTGSVYLCAVGLLHLGLPASDAFWSEADQPWTQKRLWAGEDLAADHALHK